MAFNELERHRYERIVASFVERRRPPPHIRPKLDLGARVVGQSVEIFEIRPSWREPHVRQEHGVAKATFVKTQKAWKVYWLRADLKWHSYLPLPVVATLEKFLAEVERDPHGCFFG